jgi:hypothetical protein
VPVISDTVPGHDDMGPEMPKLKFDITMSLDGFIAGPNPRLEQPLGDGGERLHQWGYGLESFRERHGLEGGASNRDAEILEESLADHGAAIMGRRMFGVGTARGTSPGRAGGATNRPSACRCSSSPITRASL